MNSRGIKAKGLRGENPVVEFLRARGFPAERRRLTGSSDCGDITGLRGLVISVKNEKRINLSGYLRELEKQVASANKRFPEDAPHRGLLIVKRRGMKSAANWYAVTTADSAIDAHVAMGFVPKVF